jgi:hypothetical protein
MTNLASELAEAALNIVVPVVRDMIRQPDEVNGHRARGQRLLEVEIQRRLDRAKEGRLFG